MTGSEALPPVSLLKWNVRDRDKKPEGMKFIIAAILLSALFGTWLLGPQWMVLGPMIVVGSLSDYLFGRTFELTEQDARCRVLLSLSAIHWSDVRRVIQTDTSILLSPLSQSGWRDGFRGIQLNLSPEIKECALEIVRERIPADATYSVE